jgi:hypothetical protein
MLVMRSTPPNGRSSCPTCVIVALRVTLPGVVRSSTRHRSAPKTSGISNRLTGLVDLSGQRSWTGGAADHRLCGDRPLQGSVRYRCRAVTRVPQLAKAVLVPPQLPTALRSGGPMYSASVQRCSIDSLATHRVLPSIAVAP